MNLTRRATIAGALTSTFALAPMGVRASAPVPESISEKIDRLTSDLSDAMGEFCKGQFYAVVGPNNQVFLRNRRFPIGAITPEQAELLAATERCREAMDAQHAIWNGQESTRPDETTYGRWRVAYEQTQEAMGAVTQLIGRG